MAVCVLSLATGELSLAMAVSVESSYGCLCIESSYGCVCIARLQIDIQVTLGVKKFRDVHRV